MREQSGLVVNPEGISLQEYIWRPEGPSTAVVALVHGIYEHAGRYAHVAQHLTEAGFAVHAIDLRGHGKSHGPRGFVKKFDEFLDDAAFLLDRVATHHAGVPVYLMGHSLGGLICTLLTLERGPTIEGLILSSPALALPHETAPPLLQTATAFLGKTVPKFALKRLDPGGICSDPAVVQAYERDPLVFHGKAAAGTGAALLDGIRRSFPRLEEITVPFLAFHGTSDRIVDIAGTEALYKRSRSSDKTFETFEGFYHETLNEPEHKVVLSLITYWLRNRT